LSSCYAMAETTFAVTQTPSGVEPAVLAVARQELSRGRVRPEPDLTRARMCVSSGVPIRGCEVRIVNDEGQDVDETSVGEIIVRSVSLFDGYRNYPEKTAETVRNGWYYTGDLGFVSGDNCYVIGRKKDLIIVAGNNIYPEDLENVVGGLEGVIAGRVVAFGEENAILGTEQVAVMAETSWCDECSRQKLRVEILKAGMSIDVSIKSVYLVPPRYLIKSSSGKPSRGANRARVPAAGQILEWESDDRGRTETSRADGAAVDRLGYSG
jgi:fatty-acyl-CoA synthase